MARLTRADVEHVARLARLALDDDEVEQFTRQLAVILDHADQGASLAAPCGLPSAHPLPLGNVFRADEPRPCLDRDEVLAAAPEAYEGQFRVPRILDAP